MTRYLITEPLQPLPCRCGAWVLAGHTGGIYVKADPIPLGEHEELTALLDGRHTYDIHAEVYRHALYLEWRDAERIAGERTHAVVTDHRCGRPIGQPAVAPEPAAVTPPPGDKPPY